MSLPLRLVRTAFGAFGLRVMRARPANRFDAMCDWLRMIARAGFEPTIVIDAGANVGQWARKASDAFPGVPLHLIEPQAACQAELRAFALTRGSVEIHQTAVTRPGRPPWTDIAALASRVRDGRLRMGDVVFVRSGSALTSDDRWA